MKVTLVFLDPEFAETKAKELLAKDPDGKFKRVFDHDGLKDQGCVLIEVDGRTVGFAVISSEGATCEIYRFFIVPACRGKGVGTEAAVQLTQALRGDGYRRCYLQIDDDQTRRFWVDALGPLTVGNESARMFFIEL
jgi:RimJ/RimL family protein N-acetyltransferase